MKRICKKVAVLLATAMLGGLLTGCSSQISNMLEELGNNSSEESQPGGTAGTESSSYYDNEEEDIVRLYAHEMDLSQYVTIKDYSDFRVSRDKITISDEEVMNEIRTFYVNSFRKEYGVKDRGVIVGDTVNIDYVGKKDGVAFSGGTASGDLLTIGSGRFIVGFEEGLIGVKEGETVDLNLTFPDSYHNEELAGQPVVFTVTVNFIIPEEIIFESFAEYLPEDIDTMDALVDYVKDVLYQEELVNSQDDYEYKIIEQFLAEKCEFKELPENWMKTNRKSMKDSVVTMAMDVGTDPETLIKYYFNQDYNEFLDSSAKQATERDLAMQMVARQEKFVPDDEAELDAIILTIAQDYEITSVEEFLSANAITKDDFREGYGYQMAWQHIVEIASQE